MQRLPDRVIISVLHQCFGQPRIRHESTDREGCSHHVHYFRDSSGIAAIHSQIKATPSS
jgi:hypothetical protein